MKHCSAVGEWLVIATCVGMGAGGCGQEVDLETTESTPLLHTLELGEGNSIGFYEFAPGVIGVGGVMSIDSLELFHPQELDGTTSLSDAFARLAPNEPVPLALEQADERVRESQGKEIDLAQIEPFVDVPEEALGSPGRAQQAAILCSPDLANDLYGQTWFYQTFFKASKMPLKSIQFNVASDVYYMPGPCKETNSITFAGNHWYGHTHELYVTNGRSLSLIFRVHVPPRSYAFSTWNNIPAGLGIRNGAEGPCRNNHMTTQCRP